MATVRVEREHSVLNITLACPDRRNAFNADVIRELHEALDQVGDARAVRLAGEGPSFSAGADVDWMRASVDLSRAENIADAERLRAMLTALDACPAPTIACVQGHAMGGGVGLIACCDIGISDPDTRFAFSESKLGLVPSTISPFVIDKIGVSAARRFFTTGERFTAETALMIGLIHEINPDLDGAAQRVIDEIISGGPQAVRRAKELVRVRPAGRATAELIADVRAGAEAQEGLRAFLEKRSASWIDETYQT